MHADRLPRRAPAALDHRLGRLRGIGAADQGAGADSAAVYWPVDACTERIAACRLARPKIYNLQSTIYNSALRALACGGGADLYAGLAGDVERSGARATIVLRPNRTKRRPAQWRWPVLPWPHGRRPRRAVLHRLRSIPHDSGDAARAADGATRVLAN